jgi:hypothetical protein
MTTFRSNFARSFLGGAEKNRKSVWSFGWVFEVEPSLKLTTFFLNPLIMENSARMAPHLLKQRMPRQIFLDSHMS